MKIDAHLSCGTGDIGVERWGKSDHGQDKRKGPSQLVSLVDKFFQSGGRHRKEVKGRGTLLVTSRGRPLIIREVPVFRALTRLASSFPDTGWVALLMGNDLPPRFINQTQKKFE